MLNRRLFTAWRLLKSGKLKEIFKRTFRLLNDLTTEKIEVKYSEWRERWVELNEVEKKRIIEIINSLPHRPIFALLLDVKGGDAVSVFSTINSVMRQLYPNWLLFIMNNDPSDIELSETLSSFNDSRIKIITPDDRELDNWIIELTPKIELHEMCLFATVNSIIANPKIALIYADHDHVDSFGVYCDPYMKPDWNPDLFAAMDYLGPIIAYKKELWETFKETGVDKHQLLIQTTKELSSDEVFHIPNVLSTVRIADNQNHLEPVCKRVIYDLAEPEPTVSILIPTRNQGQMLERCLESIFEETNYSDFEVVLVDHETVEPRALKVIETFREKENFNVINFSGSFNFSSMMNRAAMAAEGRILVLLNNDTEIVESTWLTELVSQVSRPEVGIAGALLLFADGTIQHAGVHPGKRGLMGHGHKHFSGESSGYFSRLKAVHEVAAVTGACLAVEKSTWFDLGGLDEKNLAVAYNDIDLCFKAREKGLRVIFTPYAKVIHHESVSRGADNDPEINSRLRKELETMLSRWSELIEIDPAYSPNLSFDGGSFKLAANPLIRSF